MKIILFSLLLLGTSAYAEVYQCQVNGKTIFQSKPCSGNLGTTVGERIKENEAKNEGRPKYEAEYRHYYDSLPNPVIGMTTKEAEKTKWGRPYNIYKSKYLKDTTETWYFRNDDYYQRRELKFRNGQLIEIRE
ncbi:MAG: DUF4124 domain-containing protein [Acinetobacter sp.]|jgi:hypothetical protein|nr:MAG: DUF4124 domain-containing protein [Acinetobacter sp.]